MGKWKNWTPKTQLFQISQESEPTKPSKPSFVGFVGDVSAQNQKICLAPRKASETEVEEPPSSRRYLAVTSGGIESPSLPIPVQDQPVAHQIFEDSSKTEPTKPTKPAACVHCSGIGVCNCAACTLRRTDDPQPCCMCRLDEHENFVRVISSTS